MLPPLYSSSLEVLVTVDVFLLTMGPRVIIAFPNYLVCSDRTHPQMFLELYSCGGRQGVKNVAEEHQVLRHHDTVLSGLAVPPLDNVTPQRLPEANRAQRVEAAARAFTQAVCEHPDLRPICEYTDFVPIQNKIPESGSADERPYAGRVISALLPHYYTAAAASVARGTMTFHEPQLDRFQRVCSTGGSESIQCTTNDLVRCISAVEGQPNGQRLEALAGGTLPIAVSARS